MSTDTEKEVIVIQEEKDGSATIELPPSIPSPTRNESDDSDEADDLARQAEMADGGVDPQAEALRAQKRLKRVKRKEYHKQVSTEKDHKLDFLSRQNQELIERLSVLERKSHGSDLARLNAAKTDKYNRIVFAKDKMAEATRTGNGELQTSAQEMWFDARREYEALDNVIKKATAPQREQTIRAPDPELQRHANSWMQNNQWYDPNGKDPDSKVALTIDQAMAEEGWNPKTTQYWEELDTRLQKYLPHRYTGEADEKPIRNSRPRNVVTSSGRESSSSSAIGKNQFALTREQVSAMKDAGMWDDADKRAKMIRRYALEAKQNQGYRS
jgi:hypothetical protein